MAVGKDFLSAGRTLKIQGWRTGVAEKTRSSSGFQEFSRVNEHRTRGGNVPMGYTMAWLCRRVRIGVGEKLAIRVFLRHYARTNDLPRTCRIPAGGS
jgi:hypothetical protein